MSLVVFDILSEVQGGLRHVLRRLRRIFLQVLFENLVPHYLLLFFVWRWDLGHVKQGLHRRVLGELPLLQESLVNIVLCLREAVVVALKN